MAKMTLETARVEISNYFNDPEWGLEVRESDACACLVQIYNLLADSDSTGDNLLAEELENKAPGIFDYDERGNFVGHVAYENGYTP